MNSGLIQQLSNSIFYIIAGLTVFFAIRLVISRNIFHSAIFLAMVLMGVASVYLYLDAEFLAIAQILIYVGAIVILFLFVIMLTASIHDRSIRQVNKQVLISLVSAAAFLFLIIKVINASFQQYPGPSGAALSVKELGNALMTTYVLPFETISLILIAVLVGAIVIAKSGKK